MTEVWNNLYTQFVDPFVNNPGLLLYPSALLLGLVLVCFVVFRRSRSIRAFNNHAGRIHVSKKALSDLVNSACEKVGSVQKPRVQFTAKRGKLQLVVRLKLEEGKRLSEVSNALQAQLSSTLQETLSIEKIGRIDIIVTGFIKKKQTLSNSATVTSAQMESNSAEEVEEETPDKEPYSTLNQSPTSADEPHLVLGTTQDVTASKIEEPEVEDDFKIETPAAESDLPEADDKEDFTLTDSPSESTEPEKNPPEKRSFFGLFGGSKKNKPENEETPLDESEPELEENENTEKSESDTAKNKEL